MGPVAQSEGHDRPGLVHEPVPSIAAVVEDVGVGGEDPVRQLVVAHELPDVLDRGQLGRLGREREERDVGRDHEPARLMPADSVHENKGMSPGGDPTCAISARCRLIPSLVQRGRTRPAPFPCVGQIAPKM